VGKPLGGRELPPNRVTLTQLIEQHLAEHKGAPGTVGSYRSLLVRHLTPTIGRLRIALTLLVLSLRVDVTTPAAELGAALRDARPASRRPTRAWT
jgi:hypothetical protein